MLSILLGVNAIRHKLNGSYDSTSEDYRDGTTAFKEKTKEALPATNVVVCEPSALRLGVLDNTWFPEFETRRQCTKGAADAAGPIQVPFQEMFDEAVAPGTEPENWAYHGAHPCVAGQALTTKTRHEIVGVRDWRLVFLRLFSASLSILFRRLIAVY